ncbi:hypothetical protein K432DRAFT_80685 [Lepidopterella palustris CBS 459.81]|uniref:Uncharacterized protein n=1 Tax=Lepidopterella palustris CBS 459.81 TaxID=1314670 RepID=A0A8E2JDS7_9PEZI|nr:hypothetical protein K432DRAFT_80685 [Lepidopterella palustris CBS 459.81]
MITIPQILWSLQLTPSIQTSRGAVGDTTVQGQILVRASNAAQTKYLSPPPPEETSSIIMRPCHFAYAFKTNLDAFDELAQNLLSGACRTRFERSSRGLRQARPVGFCFGNGAVMAGKVGKDLQYLRNNNRNAGSGDIGQELS